MKESKKSSSNPPDQQLALSEIEGLKDSTFGKFNFYKILPHSVSKIWIFVFSNFMMEFSSRMQKISQKVW